jgi:hypothetical protein
LERSILTSILTSGGTFDGKDAPQLISFEKMIIPGRGVYFNVHIKIVVIIIIIMTRGLKVEDVYSTVYIQ